LIVADKRCENGHFIDESWDLCPYCPPDKSEPDIPIIRPARMPPEPPRAPQPQRGPITAVPAPAAPAPPPRRDVPAPVQTPPMERTVAVQKADAGGQAKRYVVGWLVGLSGGVRGESHTVRIGRNVLGRDRHSDVVINDDQASAHHADLVFRPEERRFILMDHNSTNGTYVNETEIEPRRDLVAGDVVRIGSHRFLFVPLCGEGFIWDSEGVLQ
jgi:pSer/pThr/pTyr-binding forkhead associated (FHA) protein